ncbi:hypothetical protein LPJ61_000395 [Coemansia biformis]|uniref:RING-type domain-containing protein n=1 Tax=Coemansia biformis TaxID=1286918 RepID=A0A9W7YGT5_9FUNG|nr:hypothetical protein LPJ61_000395 [Coemansia biformis]
MPRERHTAGGTGDDIVSESLDTLRVHADGDDDNAVRLHSRDGHDASDAAQPLEYVSITSSPPNPRWTAHHSARGGTWQLAPAIVVDPSLAGAASPQPPYTPHNLSGPLGGPLEQSPAAAAASSPGSPSRKHRRATRAPQPPTKSAESSKRPKLDTARPNASLKVGVESLLNPEPESDDDKGSDAPRSRILFKCAVCLDMPDPAVFVQPCGHVFCEACAQGAVQTTMRCPVCRHSMRMRDIRILQFRVAKIRR